MQKTYAYTNEQGIEKTKELFRQVFGCEPESFYKAPGRVNIIGEHVDYNAGLCLPMALEHATFIAVKPRNDRFVRVHSAQEQTPRQFHLDQIGAKGTEKEVEGWVSYVAGVYWAFEQSGHTGLKGADIVIDSCVPYGAGLSSSAALECSIAVYLADSIGVELNLENKISLASMCVKAENEVAGAPTGGMDQSASIRCETGKALCLDCENFEAELVPFALAENNLKLLVVDTKAEHKLVDGQYANRRQTCVEAASKLGVKTLREISVDVLDEVLEKLGTPVEKNRVKHVVTEIYRTRKFIKTISDTTEYGQDIKKRLGDLMTASHESLRHDYEVSCKELDLVVDTMINNGAWGARMTGGGFGGCAIALIEAEDEQYLIAKVSQAFEKAGYTSPSVMTATPFEGARKL